MVLRISNKRQSINACFVSLSITASLRFLPTTLFMLSVYKYGVPKSCEIFSKTGAKQCCYITKLDCTNCASQQPAQ